MRTPRETEQPNRNAVLVLKIYGRFMPSQQDRDKWERICDDQDQEFGRGLYQFLYHPSKRHEPTTVK